MNKTRRAFLRSVSVAAASLCGGCSLSAKMGKRQPDKIIDTHVHFYNPYRPQGIPWPTKRDALLYRTVLPKDYRLQAVPQRVDGVIVVEASPWLEDNQWILDLAEQDPLIVGFVGNLPIGTAVFAEQLKRFSSNSLFRGFRIREGSLEAGLKDRLFLRDMHDLSERGLSFDVHSPPKWVEQAVPLAQAVPGLRLIVNHVANVSVTGGPPPEAWVTLMKRLAEQPNIFMKISGLVEGTKRTAGDAPMDAAVYRPILESLWRFFGPDRLIYGSNWPVCGRYAPLDTVQRIAMDFFASKGQAALDKVFWKNSIAAYHWKKRADTTETYEMEDVRDGRL